MEFKERLKAAMEHRGVTSYSIGRDTPLKKQSILNYLSGTRATSEAIIILADYLNINRDWMLFGDGEMDDGVTQPSISLEAKSTEIKHVSVDISGVETENGVTTIKLSIRIEQ